MRIAFLLAMLALFGFVTGCSSAPWGVADTFSEAHFCPKGRMQVRERPDVVPGPTPLPPLPDSVEGDPERAALWRSLKEGAALGSLLKSSDSVPVEISGCGFHGIYVCTKGRRGGCGYGSLRALREDTLPPDAGAR